VRRRLPEKCCFSNGSAIPVHEDDPLLDLVKKKLAVGICGCSGAVALFMKKVSFVYDYRFRIHTVYNSFHTINLVAFLKGAEW
jgi:hypothetical protein